MQGGQPVRIKVQANAKYLLQQVDSDLKNNIPQIGQNQARRPRS